MGGRIFESLQRYLPERLVKLNWLRWARWLLIVAIMGAVALTLLARHEAQARVTSYAASSFAGQTQAAKAAVTTEMQAYENVLAGFRGLYEATGTTASSHLQQYQQSLNIAQNYPGLGPASFVANQSSAGHEKFIVQASADGQASGADLAADTTERQALEHARDTGRITASQPLADGQSFSIVVPIYVSGSIPETAAARSSQLSGFIKANISYASFFANAFGGNSNSGITYQIYDTRNAPPIYKQNVLLTASDKTYHSDDTLALAERTWRFVATAPAAFAEGAPERTLSGLIVVVGAGLAALLVVCFWLDSVNRRRAAQQTNRMTMDLSDERQSALAQQSKDAAILSSIADGVFALDMDGKIILFNKAASTISGRKSDDVLGKHFAQVLQFARGDKQPGNKFIEKALKGQVASAPSKTVLVRPGGREVPVANTAAPIIDDSGKQLGVIVIFRDISHERELEQAKTEFVSLVSHQLRAPLTAMRLFVEMLLDEQVGALNEQQRDYLVKVEISTARMIDLVSDFLNTSRIELDRLKVEPRMLQLEDLVEDSIEALRPLAAQKHLKLSYNKPSLPPVSVEANLYNQIVNNLLNNAIRYTPTGGSITVSLRRTDTGYQLDVADTGIGIPKQAQEKLFQRFYRADNAIRVESEGSGLGLYLIKRILELSHGRVWFESDEGKGTTFHVLIPLTGMTPKAGVTSLDL